MLHGSQARRPPTQTMGKARVGSAAALSGSPWNQECPKTRSGEDCYCERPHRAREKINCLVLTVLTCKSGGVETCTEVQASAPLGGGGVSLCFRPPNPQQVRKHAFLEKKLKKGQGTTHADLKNAVDLTDLS